MHYKGPIFVIFVITAVVILTVAMSIGTWRNRTNPTVVNQAPAVQQPVPAPLQ